MPLDSRAAYQDWGDDEDEDSMSAVKWASPAPNAVLVSGGKLVATWSTPARPVASPSFQLCLVETEECGDTIWPKVKKLSGGQYTITLKVPQLGSDNDFFVRMVDDKGTVYDTPEFKLQGSESPNAALALNSGSSSSPSVLPDSLTSSLPGSGLPGSTLSGVGHEGSNGDGSNGSGPYSSGSEREGKGRSQSNNGGADWSAPKNAGKSGSVVNGTATTSVSGNSTASATSIVSSSAITPSITKNALIGGSNDHKPSTAAIVVPLAIFAVALAGLIFSLRQRSKAKEIRALKNEAGLNRVNSKNSRVSGLSTNSSGSSPTDLERAMNFIAGVRASQSPRLTPLPPSIESRRRERREIRMQQSDASTLPEVSPERKFIPPCSSLPVMDQQACQQDRPLPSVPNVTDLGPPNVYPRHEIPRSATYPVVQSYPSELSQTAVYQLPTPAPVENLAHPPTHYLAPSPRSYHDALQTASVAPATHLPTSISFTGMPRASCFMQPQVLVIPSSMSQPSFATGLIHHSASITPAPVPNLAFPQPPILPDSLRAALPRPLTAHVPDILMNPGHLKHLEPQPQPQPEYKSVDQSPTRLRPAVPYSTRPQTIEPQASVVSNPYDAIAKALRTPRL